MIGRGCGQHIKLGRLVISVPAIIQEPAFWPPTQTQGGGTTLRPSPIHPTIQRIGQIADLGFAGAVKIAASNQHARHQQAGIHHRQLALPDAQPALHIKEMIVETLVSGDILVGALRAAMKEPQRGKGQSGGMLPADPAPLNPDRIARQRKSHHGNTDRRALARGVSNQTVRLIYILGEIAESSLLATFK